MTAPRRSLPLLAAYPAKQCARRTHNDYDPTMTAPEYEVSEATQALFDGGNDHERKVVAAFVAALGSRCVDLNPLDGQRATHTAATVQAMTDGVDVIIGGQLPADTQGRRVGKPDLLLRHGQRPDGRAGYLPGDIKHHLAVRLLAGGTLRYSTMAAPLLSEMTAAPGLQARRREDDDLQLAHYWRMLEAAGFDADTTATGAILGSDSLFDEPYVLIWHNLELPWHTTYSRSLGVADRSALERYDHEFGFRLAVADVAVQQTGQPGDPAPLVDPLWRKECSDCPWHDVCWELLDPDDPTLHLTGRLDTREWDALRGLGVDTIEALAGYRPELLRIDPPPAGSPEARLLVDYLPEVTHRARKARERLAEAVERAQMHRDGIQLRRTTTGPLNIPRADVEIDFDLEWGKDNRCYLWGFLTDDGHGEPAYTPFVDWQVLHDTSEAALAARALTWLLETVKRVEQSGRTVRIYHYHHPEISKVRVIVAEQGHADLPSLEALNELFERSFTDLCKVVAANFQGLHGLGLKPVANALGFTWRDEDPGGLQSQEWLSEARNDNAVRCRVLQYNEDDNRGTRCIRQRAQSGVALND